MSLAGAPSLRELRARAVTVLEAAALPFNPNVVSSPVNPIDANALPEVHVFDGGRNSTKNSVGKLYAGAVILSIGIEVTVKAKDSYADDLDELTDAILNALATSDSFLEGIGNIESYNTRPEYEKAETPLARNIITVNMSSQERFKATNSGNPQPLEQVKTTIDTGGPDTPKTVATFEPPQ